ncbi:MAG TPA: Ig-like domain-containing protein, partial [Roseiflexaceae bacterium]
MPSKSAVAPPGVAIVRHGDHARTAAHHRKGAFVRVLRWAGRLWTAVLIVTVLLAVLLGGLRLLLPIFGSPPALVAAAPPDGAAGVSPRANVTLTFSGSMNPRSVERALLISPVLRWTPIWNADRTTLTISPTETLRPDTSYVLSLGAGALSQGFRPLAQPVDLRFRTAPAPAVVQVLPADAADVPLDTPISVTFSRTIVPVTAVMRPAALPEIHFEPPISGSAIWLDQVTVLFRPAEPLRPGTRYRATIDAALADVTGAQL